MVRQAEIITPEWVNLDGGDFELVLGLFNGTLKYYKKNAAGKYLEETGTDNPFNGIDVTPSDVPSNTQISVAPTFADVDGNGTIDLLVGTYNDNTLDDDVIGKIHYFKNESGATSPNFTEQTGTDNPFSGVSIEMNNLFPKLVDVDGDNDFDLVVGVQDGTFRYYKNEGTTTTPSFTEQTGANNPFNNLDVGANSRPTFADLDGDGDLDFISARASGTFQYYENVGTSYEERTGNANPFRFDSRYIYHSFIGRCGWRWRFRPSKGGANFVYFYKSYLCRKGIDYQENRGGRFSHIAHAFWQTTFDVTSLSAGSVTITATQTDSVGNPSTQDSVDVTRNSSDHLVNINSSVSNINIANQGNYSLGGQCSEVGASSVTVNVGITGSPNQATATASCESDNTWAVASFNVGAVSESNAVEISVTHGSPIASATVTVAKDVTKPSQPVIDTNQPGIDTFNDAVYTVSGTCTPGTGEKIRVAVGSDTIPSYATCGSDSSWSTTFNLTSLGGGSVTITAAQIDSFGNSSTVSSSPVTRDATQIVTFSPTPEDIDENNVWSYSLGGTCSQVGESVTVIFGIEGDLDQVTVTPNCQSDHTWTIENTNLQGVSKSDSVQITATHGSATPPATATATVMKTVVTASLIAFAASIDASDPSSYSVLGQGCVSGATLAVTVTVEDVSSTQNVICAADDSIAWTANFDMTGVEADQTGTIRAIRTDSDGDISVDTFDVTVN